MFGKIRSSSSSLESFELQRPPSKLPKADALSIYEATLLKLKRGSQCKLSTPSMQPIEDKDGGSISTLTHVGHMKIDTNCSVSTSEFAESCNGEAMPIDKDCYSPEKHTSYGEKHSMASSKEQEERSVSILYMFSKLKNVHQHALSSSSVDTMNTMENDCSISASPSFSSCGSLDSTEQQLEQECATSLPVSNL